MKNLLPLLVVWTVLYAGLPASPAGEPVAGRGIVPAIEALKPAAATAAAARPMLVVPAGSWQAARPLGEYSMASCVVGPGFDFADFELLADLPEQAERLRRQNPDWAALI